MRVPARPWVLLLAVLAACETALTLRRLAFRLPFDDLLSRLRAGGRFSGVLAEPMFHLRVVNRLLSVLPPSGMGPCMKRSLLLLRLWSRCGLAPSLHLGVATAGVDGFRAHAWLTAEAQGMSLAAGSGEGYTEAFVFPPDIGSEAGGHQLGRGGFTAEGV